ncbi:MAG: DEAD/DEAH box helicase, partial [Candidatus Eremiobacterota bacterium]
RGPCFFLELPRGVPVDALLKCLSELSFQGLITNDTFQPLRLFGRTRRRPGRNDPLLTGGRWSLVRSFFRDPAEPSQRMLARAHGLLERYGVVSREAVSHERTGSLYAVYKAMEEAGAVRRGYFVEGLGGAQFAYPGAVDRLRAAREQEPKAVLLASTDPANPYGSLLPWPPSGARPRRTAGTAVVLSGGELAFYAEKNGRKGWTFPAFCPAAVACLGQMARRQRGKLLRVEQLDGEPAAQSPHAPTFREAGFRGEIGGLVWMEAPEAMPQWNA